MLNGLYDFSLHGVFLSSVDFDSFYMVESKVHFFDLGSIYFKVSEQENLDNFGNKFDKGKMKIKVMETMGVMLKKFAEGLLDELLRMNY